MTSLTSRRPIRLMLVDDHALLRAGLANLLAIERDLEVVAQAGSGEAAISLCRQHCPDVVLLDLNVLGIGGVEAIRQLQKAAPACRIIVLTSSESAADADCVMGAGASGYLTKVTPFQEIVEAIREVNRGATGLCKGVSCIPASNGGNLLSPREYSVLLLLRKGLSNPEIGRSLGITERTVKSHVAAILEKFGETDRTAAVAKAFDLGLLRAESPRGS